MSRYRTVSFEAHGYEWDLRLTEPMVRCLQAALECSRAGRPYGGTDPGAEITWHRARCINGMVRRGLLDVHHETVELTAWNGEPQSYESVSWSLSVLGMDALRAMEMM